MKIKTFIFTLIFMTIAFAMFAGYEEGYVEEIAIKESTSEYDIHVRVRWTGTNGINNGGKSATPAGNRGDWMIVRHGEFGHRGVDRVYAQLLTAFTMQKTLVFCYEDPAHPDRITKVYLKYTKD